MDDWSAHFGGKKFITDLGQDTELPDTPLPLERYAVWVPQGEGHQIVEVSGDLEALQSKYGVPDQNVCRLVRR